METVLNPSLVLTVPVYRIGWVCLAMYTIIVTARRVVNMERVRTNLIHITVFVIHSGQEYTVRSMLVKILHVATKETARH